MTAVPHVSLRCSGPAKNTHHTRRNRVSEWIWCPWRMSNSTITPETVWFYELWHHQLLNWWQHSSAQYSCPQLGISASDSEEEQSYSGHSPYDHVLLVLGYMSPVSLISVELNLFYCHPTALQKLLALLLICGSVILSSQSSCMSEIMMMMISLYPCQDQYLQLKNAAYGQTSVLDQQSC